MTHSGITAATLLRNPITAVRLWRLTLAGEQPAPWELELVLPRAWLRRRCFWSRPRPGDAVAGSCWLQGEFQPGEGSPACRRANFVNH